MSYLRPAWLFGTSLLGEPMDDGIETRTINVGDEDCEVTAHQIGNLNWKAYGYVNGVPVHADGDTAPLAFSRWRNSARTVARR